MAQSSIPTTELFWSLVDKGDRKFSHIRDLPNFGRSRNDAEFQKLFKIYTQLWMMQQEHRQKLMEAGLKRWEIGEIASRIAQLYYGQYQKTSDSGHLHEAYVFYEAILTREYFRDASTAANGLPPEAHLANKQLRFYARFLVVCLVLGRRDMVTRLAHQLRTLVDECKRNTQELEIKEWKHVVQDIIRFLKHDSPFMNMRPLRYSFVYDNHPDYLPVASFGKSRKGLVLRNAILSSYCHNEVKFAELTLDTFRMLQCLEWEPCGSFSLSIPVDSSGNGTGPNRINLQQDIRDPMLPPNPQKVILYRPTVTHFLVVLATLCDDLPPDWILLIYLSASVSFGEHIPSPLSDGVFVDDGKQGGTNSDTTATPAFPITYPLQPSRESKKGKGKKEESCLWLGSLGTTGSFGSGPNNLYPCDLIPFTRKPLFLIIDSNSSHAFKGIYRQEKGDTIAILLSPASSAPNVSASKDSVNGQGVSQFTLFLTAPVQAFSILLGVSGMCMDKEIYKSAEKLLSLALREWEKAMLTSDELHPTWIEVLGDPFLRRLLLRFVFCRAVLALYTPTFHQEEFLPVCHPGLPDSVSPTSAFSESAVLGFATFLGVRKHFTFSEGASPRQCFADHFLHGRDSSTDVNELASAEREPRLTDTAS
ncbi:hypothetical protein HPP92_008976 [Vanilla planifolia]|uniref:Protein SCAI n=1 Tax=Vanilla planifolia TaxID=51239 RepID=A0A835V498_VANPL|nr:hypothetical protein HPP92_008976 [Vanilla planifolia]